MDLEEFLVIENSPKSANPLNLRLQARRLGSRPLSAAWFKCNRLILKG
jgi:hypothetical protein